MVRPNTSATSTAQPGQTQTQHVQEVAHQHANAVPGRVKRVLKDKQFGFISTSDSLNQKPAPPPTGGRTTGTSVLPQKDNHDSDDELFFHFDRVQSFGMELLPGDVVEVTMDTKAPDKLSDRKRKASSVKLTKLVAKRDQCVFDKWLTSACDSVEEDDTIRILACTQGCPVWWEILDNVASKDTNNTVQVMKTLIKLQQCRHVPKERFRKLLNSVIASHFFDSIGSPLICCMEDEQLATETRLNLKDTTTQFLLSVACTAGEDKTIVARLFPLLKKLTALSDGGKRQLDDCIFEFLRRTAAVGDTDACSFMSWNDLPLAPTKKGTPYATRRTE